MKNRTAAQAYAEQLAEARRNLAVISEALERHVGQTGCHAHWGHVGDLAHLNELLSDARKFIRNEEV